MVKKKKKKDQWTPTGFSFWNKEVREEEESS